MSEPLFEVEHPDPARVIQECDDCEYLAWASDDALRVRGWLVYDGTTEGGQPATTRVCPKCQRKRVRVQQLTERQHQEAVRRALAQMQPTLFETAPPTG